MNTWGCWPGAGIIRGNGHTAVAAGKPAPIPLDGILAVARVSIEAAALLRAQSG